MSTLFSENLQYSGDLRKTGVVTKGSILSNDGTGIFEPVSPASDGQVLGSNSATSSGVEWVTPTVDASNVTGVLGETNGGTGESTYTTGDILYSNAANSLAKRGIGSDGQILTVSSGVPVWQTGDTPVWQTSSNVISPASASDDNMIISNNTNNTVSTSISDGSVISSQNSRCFNSGGTAAPRMVSVIASDNCSIEDIQVNPSGPMQNCAIVSSIDSIIRGDRADECFIAASDNCDILTDFSVGFGPQSVIIGCTSCTSTQSSVCLLQCSGTTVPTQTSNSVFIACSNPSISNNNSSNVVISANSSVTLAASNCFVKARTANITSAGSTVITDTSGGTTLTTPSTNAYYSRFVNGETHYTNSSLTTGVTLAAGGSSWGAVSDVNKKENLVEVNYEDILDKLLRIRIYFYNFKGNPAEQKCIGPMAQDWNDKSNFGLEDVKVYLTESVEDEKTKEVKEIPKLDENGEKMYDVKPAKDPLSIEIMDALGVSLAAIKALNEKIVALENRIEHLESNH